MSSDSEPAFGRATSDRKFSSKKGNSLTEDSIRTQPHNIEAEEGLLAACLIDGGHDVITTCIESHISPECFFKTQHQIIFSAIIALFEQGNPVDEITPFLVANMWTRTGCYVFGESSLSIE